MGLLDLIRGTQKTATEARATATRATESQEFTGSVAKIAVTPSSDVKNTFPQAHSRPDADRYCWPQSVAMNTAEIELFIRRRQMFLAKGLDEDMADTLGDTLVTRDRNLDDRRVCFECSHLKGFTVLRCDNWRAAGIAATSEGALVHKDFGTLLKRCDGFG